MMQVRCSLRAQALLCMAEVLARPHHGYCYHYYSCSYSGSCFHYYHYQGGGDNDDDDDDDVELRMRSSKIHRIRIGRLCKVINTRFVYHS